jgi:hypothetical protein
MTDLFGAKNRASSMKMVQGTSNFAAVQQFDQHAGSSKSKGRFGDVMAVKTAVLHQSCATSQIAARQVPEEYQAADCRPGGRPNSRRTLSSSGRHSKSGRSSNNPPFAY